MLDFQDMFESYRKTKEKTWAHDRSKTVGASEIFGCIRKGWLEKHKADHGFDRDSDEGDSWGAAFRGDILEEHYVNPALLHATPEGCKLLMVGENQVTLIDGLNSATPDGLLVGLPRDALAKYGVNDIKSNCIMIEIKSIDPRFNLMEEKAIHHGQCQQQMGIIRAKTKWRPYYAVILYVDASFLDQITVFVVKYEEGKYKAAKKRADIIMNETDPSLLRPEGIIAGGCQYCKWTKACATISKTSIPTTKDKELDMADQEKLLDMAIELKEIEAQAKELEAEVKERKQDIKDELIRLNQRWFKVEGQGIVVDGKWGTQKGRETLDSKALEESGIDLTPFKKRGEDFETFKIQVKAK